MVRPKGNGLRPEDPLQMTSRGLYCPSGDFHIDPWRPVARALVTHAHSDHASPGHRHYLCAQGSVPFIQHRLQTKAVEGLSFGEKRKIAEAVVSFHPAGHCLGSAQIRVETRGQVWVISGDYKRQEDRSCEAFEVVPCDVFVTEATFALPIYRWDAPDAIAAELMHWWSGNASRGKNSIIYCYALGKAQRLLALLRTASIGPIYLHGALERLTTLYRDAGKALAPAEYVNPKSKKGDFEGALILAPPSAYGSVWTRRFQPFSDAFASGWMAVRGIRRRRGYDHGFVLSDHVDWSDLLQTVRETGASRVLATHGETDTLARYLREIEGLDAGGLDSPFGDETQEAE